MTVNGESIESFNGPAESASLYPRKMREFLQALGYDKTEAGLPMDYYLYSSK